jgi:hypothetical protein
MPKYLVEVSYTLDGMKGLSLEPPIDHLTGHQ